MMRLLSGERVVMFKMTEKKQKEAEVSFRIFRMEAKRKLKMKIILCSCYCTLTFVLLGRGITGFVFFPL